MKKVSNTGAKIVLDTRKKYLEYGLEMKPFLIKPNKDELEEIWCMPRDNPSAESVSQRLLNAAYCRRTQFAFLQADACR